MENKKFFHFVVSLSVFQNAWSYSFPLPPQIQKTEDDDDGEGGEALRRIGEHPNCIPCHTVL